jgi:mannose-6-phosphate isomerase-like protein (cupin superfamily)
MSERTSLSLEEAFARLRFLPDRTPESTGTEASFCKLAAYRDGGIFLTHYAGCSEWERHPKGDEIVLLVEGETTLILLEGGEECPHALASGQLFVVPQNTWHRFESPHPVKVMTVTPQPTDHSTNLPT